MMDIMEAVAVARRSGDDAQKLVGAYIATNPQMAQSHTPKTPEQKAAPSAGAPGATPSGGGQTGQSTTTAAADTHSPEAVVGEYEVFKNTKDALAFFFYHQQLANKNEEAGPFWFNIKGDTLIAGTHETNTVFEDVDTTLLEAARGRGVIMLVEFENQKPTRCTPCYLSDKI